MKLNLRNPLHFVMAILMAFALSGCAGMQKPVSNEDYVQSARAQVGAVYQTIGDLKAQAMITQAQAQAAIKNTEPLEKDVDIADSLLAQGKPADAQAKAKLALAGLLAIKAQLPKPKAK